MHQNFHKNNLQVEFPFPQKYFETLNGTRITQINILIINLRNPRNLRSIDCLLLFPNYKTEKEANPASFFSLFMLSYCLRISSIPFLIAASFIGIR